MKNKIRLSWEVTLILLSCQFHLLTADGDCQTKTKTNICCHFPFIYRGRNYTDCTKDGHSKKWCSETGNYDKDKRWGECKDCERKTTGGTCCVFPFTYKGKSYSDCTKKDHNVKWCGTSSNYAVDKKWGVCQECPRKTTDGGCCVFPFTYKGKSYSHCTRTNHNTKWCSTTSNYDNDKHYGDCYGYDSCATAHYENCNKKGHYAINIAGTSKFVNVTCNLVGNVSVALISHDNNKRTFVKGYEKAGSYNKILQYNENISDIIRFVNQAESCKQFIKVECRHAMLDGRAWLEDRNGAKLPYWGGVPENFTGRGCACGMTNTCRFNLTKCNCDANIDEVLTDEGYVRNKNVLPITALKFGDTGHTNEWIHYAIGDLECVFPKAEKPALGPPRVLFTPSNMVDENRYLKITCISDICAYSYMWIRNNKLLLPTSKTILLQHVSRQMAGRYACAINTALGKSRSSYTSRVVIKYLDSPKVTVNSSVLVKEGGSVTLYCKSQGQPTLSYIWKKNGYITLGTSPQLFISNISRDATGDYVCIVSNGNDEKYSRTVKLFIQYLDTPIVLPSTPQSVNIGDTIRLFCHVTSYPKSSVFWFHNNKRLAANGRVLTIAKLTKDQMGEYICSAKNIIGSKKSSPTGIRSIGTSDLPKPIASRLQNKKNNRTSNRRNPYFAAFIVFLLLSVALAAFIVWSKWKHRKVVLDPTSASTSGDNCTFKYSELNNKQGQC